MYMVPWAQEQLGCMGDNCNKLKGSPDACNGCPRLIQANDEAGDSVDYVEFLLSQYQVKQRGFAVQFPGFEPLFVCAILDEQERIAEEISERRREMEKQDADR